MGVYKVFDENLLLLADNYIEYVMIMFRRIIAPGMRSFLFQGRERILFSIQRYVAGAIRKKRDIWYAPSFSNKMEMYSMKNQFVIGNITMNSSIIINPFFHGRRGLWSCLNLYIHSLVKKIALMNSANKKERITEFKIDITLMAVLGEEGLKTLSTTKLYSYKLRRSYMLRTLGNLR